MCLDQFTLHDIVLLQDDFITFLERNPDVCSQYDVEIGDGHFNCFAECFYHRNLPLSHEFCVSRINNSW